MAFSDLFKVYPNRNMELKACAKVAYEFGKTVAKEPSAGSSLGLDEHAINRQGQYLDRIESMVAALYTRPTPDKPYIHPTQFEIDLSEVYEQFVTGNNIVVNEDTELLAGYWIAMAVELSASQSAALAGSMTEADYTRALNNIDVIRQYINEVALRPVPDLPETSFPGADLSTGSGNSTTRSTSR